MGTASSPPPRGPRVSGGPATGGSSPESWSLGSPPSVRRPPGARVSEPVVPATPARAAGCAVSAASAPCGSTWSSVPRSRDSSSTGRSALSRPESVSLSRAGSALAENHPTAEPELDVGIGSLSNGPWSAERVLAATGRGGAPAGAAWRPGVTESSKPPGGSWRGDAPAGVTGKPAPPGCSTSRGGPREPDPDPVGLLAEGVSPWPSGPGATGAWSGRSPVLATAASEAVDGEGWEAGGSLVAPGSLVGETPGRAAGDSCGLRLSGSWVGVMPMCHRTASGGSEPQIGSSRASAGSCLGAVSRYGHSRD
jgi:hypothetical protein